MLNSHVIYNKRMSKFRQTSRFSKCRDHLCEIYKRCRNNSVIKQLLMTYTSPRNNQSSAQALAQPNSKTPVLEQ